MWITQNDIYLNKFQYLLCFPKANLDTHFGTAKSIDVQKSMLHNEKCIFYVVCAQKFAINKGDNQTTVMQRYTHYEGQKKWPQLQRKGSDGMKKRL